MRFSGSGMRLKVYGVRKVYKQLRREGFQAARCTVARLMAGMGLRDAVRGRRIKTTVPAGAEDRPEDLVQRNFRAERPDQLWVSDLTVRDHLTRLCVRRLRHRRILSADRRLACVRLAQERSGPRCARAGALGPWRGLEDVEFATLEWVWWFSHQRLLEPIGYIPPAEYEEVFYQRHEENHLVAVLN